MPLSVPQIDDRGYDAILAEALARIPVHNPEWTNFNDSDPGVTLLQLFAFMADSLLYRANLIPERNRKKFLQLLGLPLRPAAAATGVVSIANRRGPLDTVTLPRELTLLAGPVGYITLNGLDVLPVEARAFYRAPLPTGDDRARAERLYTQLYAGDGEPDASGLDFYRTLPFQPPVPGARVAALDLRSDTVDRVLWVALLTRESDGAGSAVREAVARSIAGKTLTLGLAPAWDAIGRVLRPGGGSGAPAHALAFEISTGAFDGEAPRYHALATAADGDPLQDLALVQLTLPDEGGFGIWDDLDPMEDGVGDFPPTVEEEAVAARVLCWVRIRVVDAQTPDRASDGSGSATDDGSAGSAARFSWVGINATRVSQRTPVSAQRVGTGTGEPDQIVSLANTPVIPDSVAVTVDGERWTRTDDLLTAPPEVPAGGAGAGPAVGGGGSAAGSTGAQGPGETHVFQVDREAGTIRFGTGLAGARPRAGAIIVASYAYGGGRVGNVGIGAIRTAPQLPAGLRVSNPLPTWGGDDGETVAEAERRIPLELRNGGRAVSAEDFREIVAGTPGIALGRVEVLPAWHPDIGAPAPGAVTLLLVPDDPRRPEGPVPDRLFLRAVCRHLEPRRLVTTEVHLRGPEYVPLSLSVGFDAIAGVEVALVREAITSALRGFLSPLVGGQEETGWPLEKPVEDRELWARVARVSGVASVRGVRMFDEAGAELTTLPIAGLKLPRLDRVAVRTGDPEDLAAAPARTSAAQATRRVPVPVVPASC